MLKSLCEELYDKVKPEILASLSRTRNEHNLNQYLFLDYMYLKGQLINERLSKKHISVGAASANSIRKALLHPTKKLVCINDVHLSEQKYDRLRGTILEAFEQIFPHSSKYEK